MNSTNCSDSWSDFTHLTAELHSAWNQIINTKKINKKIASRTSYDWGEEYMTRHCQSTNIYMSILVFNYSRGCDCNCGHYNCNHYGCCDEHNGCRDVKWFLIFINYIKWHNGATILFIHYSRVLVCFENTNREVLEKQSWETVKSKIFH
jgi:hypothetical protein